MNPLSLSNKSLLPSPLNIFSNLLPYILFLNTPNKTTIIKPTVVNTLTELFNKEVF